MCTCLVSTQPSFTIHPFIDFRVDNACDQGRVDSIIGPRGKCFLGSYLPCGTTTHRNKTVNVDKIKLTLYLLYGNFQQNQCLSNKKKHAIHIIHRLAWDPYARGSPGNCSTCPSVKTALPVIKHCSKCQMLIICQ